MTGGTSDMGEGFDVRSSRFAELRTQNFELRVALFPPVSPVSPVSLESGISDDVRICFLHPVDLVNFCDHHIREGSFVRDRDEQNDIRPSKAGVGLFDAGKALEYLQYIFRPPGFDLN
jgi:hypothetical protein